MDLFKKMQNRLLMKIFFFNHIKEFFLKVNTFPKMTIFFKLKLSFKKMYFWMEKNILIIKINVEIYSNFHSLQRNL